MSNPQEGQGGDKKITSNLSAVSLNGASNPSPHIRGSA
jgi:hypothetical protein